MKRNALVLVVCAVLGSGAYLLFCDLDRGCLTRPFWPGGAVQVALNAFLLYFLVQLLPGEIRCLRNESRLERGLCPTCAYDLRASTGEVCPECGTCA